LFFVAALAAATFAYTLLNATALISILVGVLSAAAIIYLTIFEFTLRDGVISYRNRFRQTSFPLAWGQKVGMNTFWAGVPGHTFTFLMRSPPSPFHGHFFRTGLVSWPSASAWLAAVNAAIEAANARDGTSRSQWARNGASPVPVASDGGLRAARHPKNGRECRPSQAPGPIHSAAP